MKNHDICDACGDVGQFLCCDLCPNAFHFACVEPPMDAVDVEKLTGKWFCNECEFKRGKAIHKEPQGLFKELMNNVRMKNPKTYILPDEIINFFEGVSSDEIGNFVDTTQFKHARYKQESPDSNVTKDKNGKFIQCYHCRKITTKKLMISCDYCPLHWHMDCLTPPMTGQSNSAKRWRCPNHVESATKNIRKQRHSEVISTDRPPNVCDNYFSITIKEEDEEEEENDEINGRKKSNENSSEYITKADIVTDKTGVVYALPEFSFQFGSSRSRDESITTSEVSTPSSYFDSSDQSKDEIDTWLSNIIHFHSGQQTILSLIRSITSNSQPNTSLSDSPIPFDISDKHKRYQQIERLLKQKNEEEVMSLIYKNVQ